MVHKGMFAGMYKPAVCVFIRMNIYIKRPGTFWGASSTSRSTSVALGSFATAIDAERGAYMQHMQDYIH